MKLQKGFTLIELMIVLAIIGIMAAMIVPRYLDYIARTEVAEGVQMADAAKVDIIDNLQNGVCTDKSAKDDESPNTVYGRYVKLQITEDESASDFETPTASNGCKVVLTYGQGKDAKGEAGSVAKAIKDKKVTLTMLNNGSYALDKENTDVANKYLPKALYDNSKKADDGGDNSGGGDKNK